MTDPSLALRVGFSPNPDDTFTQINLKPLNLEADLADLPGYGAVSSYTNTDDAFSVVSDSFAFLIPTTLSKFIIFVK